MRLRRKQFIAILVLFSLFTLTSGLCYGEDASASMKDSVASTHVSVDGCNVSKTEPAQIENFQTEKKAPISDAVLPCCVDRHNNVSISQASEMKERIIFSDVSIVPTSEIIVPDVEKKTYTSSVSPPPKPDILSSVVKIE
ncbi:MAG: hypothetical protein ACD_56C00153G0001 [uncultured bacterium]|nr:MAG: hypothetical protein ACD_56C00153G0001 [uncultured bacterium]